MTSSVFKATRSPYLLLFLGSLLCSSSMWAAEAVLEGNQETDDVETEKELSPEEKAAALAREARVLELGRELEQRQAAIEEQRSELGIYHPSLIENFSDIAAVYLELEDFDSAARTLNDALQIARINTGLYSEQQLPLLDDLIGSHVQRQDWEKVDDLVHLDHHISSRVYDFSDDQYLAAADDYGKWKLRMLRENLLQLSNNGLYNEAENLSDFYSRVLLNVEIAVDVEPQDIVRLLLGKSQADMSLARAIANTPYNYFQGTASPYITQTRCRNVSGPNGQLVRRCFNVQVENPRYRQSQIDAKRFALNRNMREINQVIERMALIRDNSDISAGERAQLDTQIANLRMEAESVNRNSRRSFRF